MKEAKSENPEGWDDFIEQKRELWKDNSVTRCLVEIVHDRDLQIAIWGCQGSTSVNWIFHGFAPAYYDFFSLKIKFLRRPVKLLNSERGKFWLKTWLISNPFW